MTRKKNKFLTFLCSLLPGAGHMYMGFMKMGLSLMGSFFLTIFLGAIFDLDAFLFLLPIIWFYAFLDANNKNTTEDEEFYQLEDDYLFHLNQFDHLSHIWNEKGNLFLAIILILTGLYFLVNPLFQWFLSYYHMTNAQRDLLGTIYDKVPQFLLAIVIIAIGIRMIRGKKKEFDQLDNGGDFDGKTY